MKAYVLHAVNDIRYEDIKTPEPEAGEVLVKVKATGICGSDIPRVYETGAHKHPLIPGHEFSGQVYKCGPGVDKEWEGKRVGVFPLIPCMDCDMCKSKGYEMCRTYSYLGSRTDGGFAEYVRVPIWNLIEIPDEVSYEQAAMLEPLSVSLHAMRHAFEKLTPSEIASKTIGISGMGTIGLLLAQDVLSKGCKHVLLLGNKNLQIEKAKKIGIQPENICDIRKNDETKWILEHTEGKGIDIFFECVGNVSSISTVVSNTAPKGTVVLVGNPASDIALDMNTYWRILRKQLTVMGIWNSSYTKDSSDDWNYALSRIADGAIHPEELISHKLKANEVIKGMELMRNKKEEYLKVMAYFD